VLGRPGDRPAAVRVPVGAEGDEHRAAAADRAAVPLARAEALDPRAVPPAAADRDLPDLRGIAVLVPEVRAGRRRLLRGRGRAVLPVWRLAGRAARPRPPLGRALGGVPRRGPGDRVRAVPVLPVPEEAGAVGGAGAAGVGAGGAG